MLINAAGAFHLVQPFPGTGLVQFFTCTQKAGTDIFMDWWDGHGPGSTWPRPLVTG